MANELAGGQTSLRRDRTNLSNYFWRFLVGREGVLLFVVLILGILIEVVSHGGLLRHASLNNLLMNIAIVSTSAIGMTFVILTAGIDVSIGAIVGLSTAVAAHIFEAHGGIPLAITVLVGVGALLGLLNSVVVSFAKVPPIIATLGTMSIFRMLVFVVLGGKWISAIPFSITHIFVLTKVWVLPIALVISIALMTMSSLMLSHSRRGRWLYALGDNPEGVRLAGVSATKLVIFAYTAMGVLSAVSALFMLAQSPLAQNNTGTGFELTVIAAVILGGTELMGGKGTIIGSFLGAIIVALVQDGVILLHIQPFWTGVILGAIILVSVASSSYGILARHQGEA